MIGWIHPQLSFLLLFPDASMGLSQQYEVILQCFFITFMKMGNLCLVKQITPLDPLQSCFFRHFVMSHLHACQDSRREYLITNSTFSQMFLILIPFSLLWYVLACSCSSSWYVLLVRPDLESTCSSTFEWELSDLRSINNDKSRRYSGLVLSETSLHTHTHTLVQTHKRTTTPVYWRELVWECRPSLSLL